jgi:hypothetical protein
MKERVLSPTTPPVLAPPIPSWGTPYAAGERGSWSAPPAEDKVFTTLGREGEARGEEAAVELVHKLSLR